MKGHFLSKLFRFLLLVIGILLISRSKAIWDLCLGVVELAIFVALED